MRFASKQSVVAFIREEPAFGYFDNFDGPRSVRPLTRIGNSELDGNVHYCLDLTYDVDGLRKLTDDELCEAVRARATSPIRRLRVRGGDGSFDWTTLPHALAEIENLIAASPQNEHGRLRALRDEMTNWAPG